MKKTMVTVFIIMSLSVMTIAGVIGLTACSGSASKKQTTAQNSNSTGTTGQKAGDLNGDNSIDAIDFALFKKYLLDPSIAKNPEAADINKDGEINALDYAALRNLLLNS